MTTPKLFATLSLLLILTSCSSTPTNPDTQVGEANVNGASNTTNTTTAPTPDTTTHKIIFAADFDTNGGCADHSVTSQCDLYTAELNLTDGTVSKVTRATDTPVSEAYPAWNPNGSVAYFTIMKDIKNKDLGYVDLSTGKTGTFIKSAAWAEVSPDGETLLYNDVKTDSLFKASLATDGLTLGIGDPSPLTGIKGQEDPQYSSDGRYIMLHEITDGVGAIGQVYDTQNQTAFSWRENSGHCAIGWNSFLTLCDNSKGGGILSKFFNGSGFGATSLFLPDPKASILKTYDSDFATCEGISFNYPNFCGDDDHLLVSTSCNVKGTVTFSRLFLIDFSEESPVYHPLGKALSNAYNGKGKDTWTVACL